jgi:hypothetical protein
MNLDISVFNYMHDAVLQFVRIGFDSKSRSFEIVATLHEDCGDPFLSGKTVKILAEDITLVKSIVHGALVGTEFIYSVETEISGEAKEILAKGHAAGLRWPQGFFTLTTTSGSFWEVAFESLTVTDRLTG